MLQGTLSVAGRPAKWAFTDRHHGVSLSPYASNNLAAHVGDDASHVRSNREQLQARFDGGELSWMGPVHGVEVALLDAATAITPNVDALATWRALTPLVTLGGDCVPVLVAAGDLVVAAHVGWRGLVDGMTARLMAVLAGHGIAAQDAQVLLGPGICGACYGISEQRAGLVRAACPEAVVPARNGAPGADIRVGLQAQWQAGGARVRLVGGCTFESPEYFSHRRDGITGRQAGVIGWVA